MTNEMNYIQQTMEDAVDRYGEDHVDLYLDDSLVYVMYHSKSNSFRIGTPMDEDCFSRSDINDLKFFADELGCGVVQ